MTNSTQNYVTRALYLCLQTCEGQTLLFTSWFNKKQIISQVKSQRLDRGSSLTWVLTKESNM